MLKAEIHAEYTMKTFYFEELNFQNANSCQKHDEDLFFIFEGLIFKVKFYIETFL